MSELHHLHIFVCPRCSISCCSLFSRFDGSEYCSPRTSSLLIELLHYFCESGGFEVLLEAMGSHLSLNAVYIAVQLVSSCVLDDSHVDPLTNLTLVLYYSHEAPPGLLLLFPHPRVQIALLMRIQNLSDRDLQIEGRDRFADLIDVAESLAHQCVMFAPLQLEGVTDPQEAGCGTSEGVLACYHSSIGLLSILCSINSADDFNG